MAAETGNQALLTSKWGPAPVWVWALGGLLLAWAFAKYRDMKNAAAASTDTPAAAADAGAAQGQAVAPQFIIENNMPQDYDPVPPATPGAPATPSQPVKSTLPQPVSNPVVTPPGTTSRPPRTFKPPAPTSKPKSKPPKVYRVQHNDTLSSIAAKEHVKGGWQELWEFNTTPGNRPASTIATLRKRGPNELFAGEEILIPQ